MTPEPAASSETWGLVLAGGAGQRFGGLKQLADVGGSRLVDRAVAATAAWCAGVVLVVPAGWRGGAAGATRVVDGGPTRSASVRAGLAAVPSHAGVVVIHDAAHPLTPRRLFEDAIEAVRSGAAGAAPVMPMTETIARVQGGVVASVMPRSGAWNVQMPHAFPAEILREAHRDAPEVSDEIALLTAAGYDIRAVPGAACNIHVTTEEELELVRRLASDRRE